MSTTEVKEFYSNDLVYRFNKQKRITYGVVVESYEGSTLTDSDYSAPLQKGEIRVTWLNSSREQVWKQNKVRLMSRVVIPGDIVRRLENGKETQRGYCKSAKQYATVQIVGTNQIIENVHCERLRPVSLYDINVPFCIGDKYGRIHAFDQKIKMQSQCGSVVEILSSINSDIEDYWLSKRKKCFFQQFYQGQEITCVPANLEQPNWISKSKTIKRSMKTRTRFTILSVEPTNVEVVWHDCLCKGYVITELKKEDIEKMKLFEPMEAFYLELGERRMLQLYSTDTLLRKRDWMRKQSAQYLFSNQKTKRVVSRVNKRPVGFCKAPNLASINNLDTSTDENDEDWLTEECIECALDENVNDSCNSKLSKLYKKHLPQKYKDVTPGFILPVEVLIMESQATIVWQDGTEETNIPTTELYYSISLDDHEFFPGEWVVRNGQDETKKFGVIQNVNYLERTASIKWFTYCETEKKQIFNVINEMSVYDLKKHPKFSFRPGSVVKELPTISNKLGQVIDSCPQGHVIVQWIDGTLENCYPQNLEQIPNPSDFDYSFDDNDDSAQVSWATESIESIPGDLTDETTLQSMAARLDFIRNRIVYLKEAFRQHNITENFTFLRDLLMVYDNSSYLDKLLDTSFFSLRSRHFQALVMQVKERAKNYGVELRGRLFTSDNLTTTVNKIKQTTSAERENIGKIIRLEHQVNAQIGSCKESEPPTPSTPELDQTLVPNENLCIELLSMLKARMDLAYAEIISRIGGNQALTVMTKASDEVATPSSSIPSMPNTPEDSSTIPPKLTKSLSTDTETYMILEEALSSHRFFCVKIEPTDKQRFFKAIQKEYKLLKESLPPGVWVRSYADRLDLLSVMIRGPDKTPYEDGLFVFDLQLSADYPRSPPLCHYISYTSERLNPNLYVEGKVCVSLLGTWMGRGTEVWGPNSTLLQLIVSIQGLILVTEPYYNEAGYEKQTESQQGNENSRTYNEQVILKLVQSMTEMLNSPPEVFKQEVYNHFAARGKTMCKRLRRWCSDTDPLEPDFPLQVSKGLKLSLNTSLESFQEVLSRVLKKENIKLIE